MTKDRMSFDGWEVWRFIKGRKKLIITGIGILGAQYSLDPELIGLLAGGAVFEAIWAVGEYWFKKKE